MKYNIVKYSPDFKDQILELQTYYWSPDVTLNAAHLEWKYYQNPYVDDPLIYIALCDGEVVGMRGLFGAKWQVGHSGQTFIGTQPGDLVIAPKHRNHGLMTKIMRFALNDLADKGCKYVLHLNAGPVKLLSSIAMGWRCAGLWKTMHWKANKKSISVFDRVRKYKNKMPFLSVTSNLVRRYSDWLTFLHSANKRADPFSYLDRNYSLCRSEDSPHISLEQNPRPEAMAELVERIGSDGCIRHVKDKQYFSWRFQNPLSLYRFLFWEDTRLEGYLVLRTSLYENIGLVGTVDWEATSLQILSALLEAAIRWGSFTDLRIWLTTLSDEMESLLRNTGFYFRNKKASIRNYPHAFMVRSVKDEFQTDNWILDNRRLLDLANWDLRMIYSDDF
ncbi:MAG: GNAT family N-acetyltransferase [Thermodesulfobacteriota bacterium]